MPKSIKERLLSKIAVDPVTDCWNWTGGTVTGGYGAVWNDGKMRRAHRISYREFCGPTPDDKDVCHHCDNPPCINPKHLFLGTTAENIADCVAKGRNNFSRGSAQHLSKLTESDVISIRSAKGFLQRELAEKYGVHFTVISQILNGKIWKHVSSA